MTWGVSDHRLDDVFGSRLLAVIALAALATNPWAGTHVHRYAEHDHPEHHHGPAVHSHDGDRAQHPVAATGAPGLAPCDPADHEVALQAACGMAGHQPEGMPAALEHGNAPFRRPSAVLIRLADVRVHGPPARTRTRPRAPPVVHPA